MFVSPDLSGNGRCPHHDRRTPTETEGNSDKTVGSPWVSGTFPENYLSPSALSGEILVNCMTFSCRQSLQQKNLHWQLLWRCRPRQCPVLRYSATSGPFGSIPLLHYIYSFTRWAARSVQYLSLSLSLEYLFSPKVLFQTVDILFVCHRDARPRMIQQWFIGSPAM